MIINKYTVCYENEAKCVIEYTFFIEFVFIIACILLYNISSTTQNGKKNLWCLYYTLPLISPKLNEFLLPPARLNRHIISIRWYK